MLIRSGVAAVTIAIRGRATARSTWQPAADRSLTLVTSAARRTLTSTNVQMARDTTASRAHTKSALRAQCMRAGTACCRMLCCCINTRHWYDVSDRKPYHLNGNDDNVRLRALMKRCPYVTNLCACTCRKRPAGGCRNRNACALWSSGRCFRIARCGRSMMRPSRVQSRSRRRWSAKPRARGSVRRMMMRRRKRARPAADAEQHRPLDDADTASMAVSDTLAAIHLLRNEFPFKGRTPPVVLKHHIYDVVYDRRQVEGELRSMAEANVCRLMRIGHDAEVGVVLTSDLIEFFNVKLETGRVTSATKSVMASFFDRVLPAHTGFFLERGHLIRDCFAGVDVEAGISILFAEGVIIRRDATSFWFSVPNAGEFAAQLAAGRQEMKSAVRRRGRSSRTESVAVLAAKPLKRSTLTAAYLVRDLVCLGAVRRVPAADGQGPLLEIVDNVP